MSELPHVIWSDTFRLFGVDVKCHTLSDGKRIIEANSMRQLLAILASDEPIDNSAPDDTKEFTRWRSAKDVTP